MVQTDRGSGLTQSRPTGVWTGPDRTDRNPTPTLPLEVEGEHSATISLPHHIHAPIFTPEGEWDLVTE